MNEMTTINGWHESLLSEPRFYMMEKRFRKVRKGTYMLKRHLEGIIHDEVILKAQRDLLREFPDHAEMHMHDQDANIPF